MPQAIEQHDADGCQQNPENLSDVADHLGRERAHVRPQLQSRERGRQERDHARDIGVRLGERDARFHPRERLKPEADAARRVHIQWHRQHDRRARPKERERRGQHADDFSRPAVDDQLLADDVVRAPETALPVAMGQHHSPRRAGRIVFGAEGATENGLHAQQRQCRRADEQSLHPFRIAASRDRHLGRIPGADPLEYLVVLAIRQIRARAVIRAGPVRRDLLQAHQPLGLVKRQRLQQHTVDDAEDRGGGANAERQRQDRGCGKGGLLRKDARRVAHVLPEIATHRSHGQARRDRGRQLRLFQRFHDRRVLDR